MVHALDHLSEGSFADDLDELVPIGNMVVLLDLVVALFIIEAVVHQAFQL